MLARFLGRIRVVGEAADAETAERLVAALDADVVLCDVRLRGSSGLDLSSRANRAGPAAPRSGRPPGPAAPGVRPPPRSGRADRVPPGSLPASTTTSLPRALAPK